MNKYNVLRKEQFQLNGFISPINIFSKHEINKLANKLYEIESESKENISSESSYKSHLIFPFLSELVRHPKILDKIEVVLGSNIMVWGIGFFIKEAKSKSFVSWHQIKNIGGWLLMM